MTARTPPKTRSQKPVLLPGIEQLGTNSTKNCDNNDSKKKLDLAMATKEMEKALEEIKRLKDEVVRLRELNGFQNDQLKEFRQNVSQSNTLNTGEQLIQTLIDSFRAITVDVKPPKFQENENPNQFFEKLEKFFILKQIPENNRTNILEGVFEGREKIWFDTCKPLFTSFEVFKTKFLEEFFSIPIRVKIKGNWLAKRFDGSKDNLQNYFMTQIREAQYFVPKLEAYELHYTVIQQMPIRVQELLATIDYSDFNKISQALNQLDLTYADKTPIQKKNQNDSTHGSHQNHNNFKSQENKNHFFKSKQVQPQTNEVATCSCNNVEKLVISKTQEGELSSRYRHDITGGDMVKVLDDGRSFPNMNMPPPLIPSLSFAQQGRDYFSNHLN